MKMIADERKQKISELLKEKDTVKVSELSHILNVSEVTIRSYLADMEKKGLLSRIHGGAVSSYKPYYSMNLNQRLETNQGEKVEIADKIASMIEPDDTIMLNSGTTTLITFRKIPKSYNLNIVTNSIAIALEASNNPNYNVVLVGGSVNTKYQFTYGEDALSQLENYHATKCILSVDGISLGAGLSLYYSNEASLARKMIECSDKLIVTADGTKLGRYAFAKITDVKEGDVLVTNYTENREEAEKITAAGVTLIEAE